MARKITIKGEVYPFDDNYSLADAIAIEEASGMTFTEWSQTRSKGSAKSLAVFLWFVLRRNGRDVPLADIRSGEFEIDFADLDFGNEGAEPDPTPASSPSTGDATSESSPTPSDTSPGTSTGSPLSSSTT